LARSVGQDLTCRSGIFVSIKSVKEGVPNVHTLPVGLERTEAVLGMLSGVPCVTGTRFESHLGHSVVTAQGPIWPLIVDKA
jgi:hypothetical protein